MVIKIVCKATGILAISLCFSVVLVAQSSCPCCTEQHRQFDFWLGDWEAYQGDTLAGTNSIVLLQDSCILRENWVSARGNYTGTSYNFYDAKTGIWHQSWIDNQGGNLQLEGKLENGKMVLYSEEMLSSKNEPYINRISWTPNPDGTVRQHWQISKDRQKTWATVFDGLYIAKKKQ